MVQFQKNQTLTTSLPQEKGVNYDLTIYNDGSNDYYPYVFDI